MCHAMCLVRNMNSLCALWWRCVGCLVYTRAAARQCVIAQNLCEKMRVDDRTPLSWPPHEEERV